jgi:hypothetical protein
MDYNSSLELYSYQRLDNDTTIRVLVLQPAEAHESLLIANLVHTDRQKLFSVTNIAKRSTTSAPTEQGLTWECVSYAWGQVHLSHDLYVDGHIVKITANVESMLRYLRKKNKTRLLWVDAICLDQTDETEKAVQVSLMGEIFRQADKIHIWLGEETQVTNLQKALFFFKSMAVVKDTKTIEDVLSADIVHSIEGVFQLLEQPWFQRRWVLQEVCLGHSVIVRCGSFKIPWDWLAEGITAFGSQFLGLCFRELHLNAIAQVVSLRRGKAPILDLLSRFHAAQSTDRRDRIFALCGMATDIVFVPGCGTYIERPGGHNKFSVDYSKSWVSTYSDFAHACVELGNTPFVLEHAISFGSLMASCRQYPSWVPDWSETRKWAPRFTILPGTANEFFNTRVLKDGDEMGLKLWGELYGPVDFIPYFDQLDTQVATQLDAKPTNRVFEFIDPLHRVGNDRVVDNLFIRVVTSAIADAHVKFSNSRFSRNSIELSKAFFGDIPSPLELSHFGTTYAKCVARIESALIYHAHDLVLRSASQSQISSHYIESPFAAVGRLLQKQKIFVVISKELRIAGIGPPEMEIGDFVFRVSNIYPETVALAVRPVNKETKTPHESPQFRLVGLCFFTEARNIPVSQRTNDEITLI